MGYNQAKFNVSETQTITLQTHKPHTHTHTHTTYIYSHGHRDRETQTAHIQTKRHRHTHTHTIHWNNLNTFKVLKHKGLYLLILKYYSYYLSLRQHSISL